MNDRRDEGELQDYLAGDSPVSRQYAGLAAAQPSPELDAQILAAAEAEVKVVAIGRPWQRWAAAVGVAATVMLAFTLVMQVALDPSGRPEVSPPPASVVLMEDAEMRQRPAPEKREAPAAARPLDRVDAPAPGRVANDVAPAELREELAAGGMQAGLADIEAEVAVAPPPAEPAPGAFAGALMKKQKPAAMDDARLASAVELIRASRELDSADEVQRRRDVRTLDEPADADSLASQSPEAGLPDARLDEVLRLYDAGDLAAAARQLEEFRTAHPQHPVSLELADTLD